MELSKIQGNPDTATYSQHATTNATPTVGITKLITLPKMADSPKIVTWSLQEIMQFMDWCQTHQLSQMSSQKQWNLIAQCFPQDTIDIMETIDLGKRVDEGLPRFPLQGLLLTEIMRCLKASVPDVGSGYNNSHTLWEISCDRQRR